MNLAAVRRFALSLPEVTEEPHFDMTSFRVRGKIFVTAPPEKTHVHVFVGETHREIVLAMYPEFIEKLLWGGKVRGVRIALAPAMPNVVQDLIRAAWEGKIGKSALPKSAKNAKKKTKMRTAPAASRRTQSARHG